MVGIASVDRELAVAERFGGGGLAGRDRKHLGEEPIGSGVERIGVVHDAAHVDVDVIRHLAGRASVARYLYDRCDRIPCRRSKAGREHHDLRAAADHAGHRLDVEPRRVHHGQALARDRRRVADDVFERRSLAPLVRRAK